MIWYDQLVRFKEKHGHCIVTRKQDNSLGIWVQKQRKFFRERQAGKTNILTTDKVVSLSTPLQYHDNFFLLTSNMTLYYQHRNLILIPFTYLPRSNAHVGVAQQYWFFFRGLPWHKIGKPGYTFHLQCPTRAIKRGGHDEGGSKGRVASKP